MSRSVDFTIVITPPLGSSVGGFIPEIHEAWNKKIINTAFGGHWSFDFHLRGSNFVDEWLVEGVGRHIEVYDASLVRVWEGFANTVEANVGTMSIKRGPFLSIGNKVSTQFCTIEWEDGEPVYGVRRFTDWVEDSASQAKYGIMQQVISTAGSTLARAGQIRDVGIQDIKDPETSEQENLESSSIPSVTIHCLGYFHFLSAYTCDFATLGEQNANLKLQAVLAAEPNGIFSTDYSLIDTNTVQVGAYEASRREALSIVKGIVALGDSSSNRWIAKFGNDRRVTYQAIPSSPVYQRSIIDPRQELERYGGGYINPWEVIAGNWVFYTDLLVGLAQPDSDFRTDPRYMFLEESTFREPWSLTLRGERVTRLKQLINQFGVGGYHA